MDAQKKDLRQELKALRASQQDAERAEKNLAIRQKLLSLPQFCAAGTVFSYISYAAEVDTHAIIDACLASEKQVLVPRITGAEPMRAVRFSAWNELSPGPLGILAPPASVPSASSCDICLTPGLGFTADGGRLGYGRGYYDKWFLENRAGLKIGLAYELQVLEQLPLGSHDVNVDLVITEQRIIRT